MAKTAGEVYHKRIRAGLSPKEIRRRFEMMVKDTNGDRILAGQNLGWILGYFDRRTCEEWFSALSDEHTPVIHPVFGPDYGRGYWPTDEETFEAALRWVEPRTL